MVKEEKLERIFIDNATVSGLVSDEADTHLVEVFWRFLNLHPVLTYYSSHVLLQSCPQNLFLCLPMEQYDQYSSYLALNQFSLHR